MRDQQDDKKASTDQDQRVITTPPKAREPRRHTRYDTLTDDNPLIFRGMD